MFGFASRVMASVVRRTALVLALALPASAWMIIAGAVQQASACSDTNSSNHCYAEAVNSNTNTNHGIYGQVDVHCLYEPNNGNFATNEIWDADSTAHYWEEAGIISGVDPNSNYDNKVWFWADSRPNGGNFHFHLPNANQANTDTVYPTEVTFVGSQTWYLYGGNSFFQIGTSINQSSSLSSGRGGTEYLGGSSSGIRNVGNVYTLERESTNNNWLNWGQGGFGFNTGPDWYINGTYDTSNSHESWSGPC